jgi:hypothetical protein
LRKAIVVASFLFAWVAVLCMASHWWAGTLGQRPLYASRTGGTGIPPPWSVEEQAACFIVRDANGWALGYFCEDEPGRRSAAKLLSKDEARRIATNIAGRLNC